MKEEVDPVQESSCALNLPETNAVYAQIVYATDKVASAQ
jgi:hypothetical protein